MHPPQERPWNAVLAHLLGPSGSTPRYRIPPVTNPRKEPVRFEAGLLCSHVYTRVTTV